MATNVIHALKNSQLDYDTILLEVSHEATYKNAQVRLTISHISSDQHASALESQNS